MTIYGKVVFILNINVTGADSCLHCLFVDDDVFYLREGTELAQVLYGVYERVGHILDFIVQGKSNLPFKCLKSSDCVDFTYRQI
jgi:hypothetical protein